MAINNCPLTYRCSSESWLDIITPNCFLRPNLNTDIVLNTDDVWEGNLPKKSDILNILQLQDDMLNKFKDIWNQEHLLSLRETCRYIYETDFSNKIKVDQVILVKNPLKPRTF